MSVTIKIMENGPVLIGKNALCRCGGSSTKPYCDGSHTNGFTADGIEIELVTEVTCGCCDDVTEILKDEN